MRAATRAIAADASSFREAIEARVMAPTLRTLKAIDGLEAAGAGAPRQWALGDAPETINEDPYGAGWLIRVRLSDPGEVDGLLFYVMPRLSPDGAEAVLETGRYLRSTPRDARLRGCRSVWS